MTTQFPGGLIDNGEEFRVKPFPLDQLGNSWCTVIEDGEAVSRFRRAWTANNRGYSATWTIEYERLYLTSFGATDRDGRTLLMADVFDTTSLFAFWYTGELRVHMGKVIYGFFEPTYEQDRVWRFEHGVVKDRYIRTNDTPEHLVKRAQWEKQGGFCDTL